MKRKLFTILAAISLLLCVAAVGLWVRSWSTVEKGWLNRSHHEIELFSYHGTLAMELEAITVWGSETDPDRAGWLRGDKAEKLVDAQYWPTWGLGTHHWMSQGREWFVEGRGLALPYWLICLIVSSPAIARACIWLRNSRRVRAGCCTACGYDLRATPERCPECGLIPETERRRDVETE